MGTDDHDLRQHVLWLTYEGLVADAARFAGVSLAVARAARPQRFSQPSAVEDMRLTIAQVCASAGAEDALGEYLSTRWLEQFQPLPM